MALAAAARQRPCWPGRAPPWRAQAGRGARLAWASAWTLAGVAGLVAGLVAVQGLPGLLGSRAGHLALASGAALAWPWPPHGCGGARRIRIPMAASRRVAAAGALALLALLLGQGFAWQGASRWRWPIGPCLAL